MSHATCSVSLVDGCPTKAQMDRGLRVGATALGDGRGVRTTRLRHLDRCSFDALLLSRYQNKWVECMQELMEQVDPIDSEGSVWVFVITQMGVPVGSSLMDWRVLAGPKSRFEFQTCDHTG